MGTVHIEANKEEISDTVLMPGDPNRCEYIAKKYLDNVKLINKVRGMTAYTGYYKNKKITIFPSGMGIPAMGIYSYELFDYYKVNNIIRVGTCGSYVDLNLKDIILVTNSYSDSGYAKNFDNYQDTFISSDEYLNKSIIKKADELNIKITTGNIFSSDVFYEQKDNFTERVKTYQALGVEMESFSLFYNAKYFNKKATTLLMVTDLFLSKSSLSAKEREQGLDNLFILALETSLKL